MLEGINSMVLAIRHIADAIFSLPFYQEVTWGHFIVAVTVMAILISFFISRMK